MDIAPGYALLPPIETGTFGNPMWDPNYLSSAVTPTGPYNPAAASLLASGDVEPFAQEMAANGVAPPGETGTGSTANAAGSIGKALSGVKAPTAPQAEIPRVQAPAPPGPNAPPNQAVILDLINQVQGRIPVGGLRLGQAIGG